MNVQRKVALITGASRGIGSTLAHGLAEDGYSLALIARNSEALAETEASVNSASPTVETSTWPLDVSDDEIVQDTVGKVVREFGHIDVLINSAGVFRRGSIDAGIDDFDTVMATNLRGTFSVIRAVGPVMRERRKGHIFNISSIAGKAGFPSYGMYCASKFALQGLGESLHKELSEHDVQVTSICPNWVATDFAYEAGGTLDPQSMIQTEDILATIRWILNLSSSACIREVVIDCKAHPY